MEWLFWWRMEENFYEIILRARVFFIEFPKFIWISWRWDQIHLNVKLDSCFTWKRNTPLMLFSSLIFSTSVAYLKFCLKNSFLFYDSRGIWSNKNFKFNKQKPLCILTTLGKCRSSLIWNHIQRIISKPRIWLRFQPFDLKFHIFRSFSGE